MGQGDDAAFGIIVIVALILMAIWAVIIFIIENFILFFCLGMIGWAIYYYVQNAPKWEVERKRKASFASKNTTSHTNFKVLYATAEHNIKVLSSSCFASSGNYVEMDNGVENESYDLDFKEDLASFSKTLKSVSHFQAQPHTMYREGMAMNHNPYLSAIQTVSSLVDETIRIPNILLSLEKRCNRLHEKGIDSDRFDNILSSISSMFTIDNHRRLSLLVATELVDETGMAGASTPASTIKV